MAKKKKQDNTKKEDQGNPGVLKKLKLDLTGNNDLYPWESILDEILIPKEWIKNHNNFTWSFKNKHLLTEDCKVQIIEGDDYITFRPTEDLMELLIIKGMDELKFKSKMKTKPTGRDPRITDRNKKIQKEYYQLHNKKGFTSKKAHEKISIKYNRSPETIKTILKKTWD